MDCNINTQKGRGHVQIGSNDRETRGGDGASFVLNLECLPVNFVQCFYLVLNFL